MRLAQVIQNWDGGGAEKLASDIALARARAGDDSHLILLSCSAPPPGFLGGEVSVHVLGLEVEARGPLGLTRLLPVLLVFKRLLAVLQDHQIEIVQTHLPLANFMGLLVALMGWGRVFPTIHNTREFDYGDQVSPVRARSRRMAYRLLLRFCHRMIAVSHPARENMVQELGLAGPAADKITVVLNGVPAAAEMRAADRNAYRSERGVGGESVLIVGAGRLGPQKNFQTLVEAAARLEVRETDWQVLVAGDGPQRRELEELVRSRGLAERFRFCGQVKDLPLLLAAADIFCLPSLWEGLPLVLLEAMAAGLPVVASAIDGVNETVQADRSALLFRPGDPDDLSSNLAGLINDPERRREMGRQGRDIHRSRFSLERMAANLGQVYRNGAAGTSPGSEDVPNPNNRER